MDASIVGAFFIGEEIKMIPTEIWCALIAGFVTLITSIGSFQMSVKKDREKAKEELKEELIKYHEQNREAIQVIREKDLREIREDISNMGANLQQKIAVLELEQNHTRTDIVTLSNRVEKHNGVIERTLRLEDNDKLLDEKIKVANHRLSDAEEEIKRLKA